MTDKLKTVPEQDYRMKPKEIKKLGEDYEIWESTVFYGYEEEFLAILASAAQDKLLDYLLAELDSCIDTRTKQSKFEGTSYRAGMVAGLEQFKASLKLSVKSGKSNFVKLSDDQSLPECFEGNRPRAKAFQDMLKAGFRRVVLDE